MDEAILFVIAFRERKIGTIDPSTASRGSQPLLKTDGEKSESNNKLAHRNRLRKSIRSLSVWDSLRASCFNLMSWARALSAPAWCSSIPLSLISASLSSSKRFSSFTGSSSTSSSPSSLSSVLSLLLSLSLSLDESSEGLLSPSTSSRSIPASAALTNTALSPKPSSEESLSSTESSSSSSFPLSPIDFPPQTDSIRMLITSSSTRFLRASFFALSPLITEMTPVHANLTVSLVTFAAAAWIGLPAWTSPPTGEDKMFTSIPAIIARGFSSSSFPVTDFPSIT